MLLLLALPMGLQRALCHYLPMTLTLTFLLTGITLVALISGCSTQQASSSAISAAPIESATTAASTPTTEPASATGKDSPTAQIATRDIPIPAASVYPLLAAEFALREGRYDFALNLLREQALALSDPEVARRALKLAEFRDQDDVALQMAIRLTALDKTDAAAASTAMALLIRSGQIERALNFAREAKRRGARINAPALLLNFETFPADKQQRIASALNTLATDWPEDDDIALAMALMYREFGEPGESLRILGTLLDRTPNENRSLVLWSQIKSQRDDPDALDRMEAALSDAPDNEPLRLQYARILAAKSRFAEAREQFLILQNLSPRNGDYLFSLALIEMEADQAEAAEENLYALLDLGQRVDEANYYLGRLAEDRNDIDAALFAYGNVGPGREFLDAQRRAGILLLDDGDRSAYTHTFITARQNSPGQAERLYMLEADLLRDQGYSQEAIAVYSGALEVFPDSMPIQYGRAMAWEEVGDIDQMEEDLRAILERDPNNTTTLNALGYTLTVHTTRYAEAAALIEQALALSPGEPAILDSLGWVYHKLGRHHEALDLLKQAYQQFPDPEVAAHLGETLWALGRTKAAVELWRSVLDTAPGNRLIIESIERLGASLD